jgi:hypothetical protein
MVNCGPGASADEQQFDFFRELLGDRDLSSELELVVGLLEYTPFAGLIPRRRALLEGRTCLTDSTCSSASTRRMGR